MTFPEFLARLHLIETESPSFMLIDSTHPYFVYYGHDHHKAPSLWMSFPTTRTRTDGPELKSTKSINATVAIDEKSIDVMFVLKEEQFAELFDAFCFDLFNHLRDAEVESAYEFLVARYNAWRHLFETGGAQPISDEQIKGLLGEIVVLKHFLDFGEQNAVVAWGGPAKADRDFEFPSSWAEVKSVKLSAQTVSISSLEQLDIAADGRLHILRIEKGVVNRVGAFGLKDMVEACRAKILDAGEQSLFTAKLLLAGYDEADARMTEKIFTLHEHAMYAVTDRFPRLGRSSVPTEIVSAKYELDIAMLAPFKMKMPTPN